jgi:hypothetical protein
MYATPGTGVSAGNTASTLLNLIAQGILNILPEKWRILLLLNWTQLSRRSSLLRSLTNHEMRTCVVCRK